MLYDENLKFDIRLVEDFKDDEEYMKKYQEYLKNLEDHSYNLQKVEI